MGPGSPAYQAIIAYIGQLKAIPTSVTTTAVLKGQGYSTGGGKKFAAGGDPPVGEAVTVGEDGPEVAVFGQPAHIYPNGTSPPVSGGGYVDQRTINYVVNGNDPRAMVEAIRKFERQNGPVWKRA
jgi:hypothetical protein